MRAEQTSCERQWGRDVNFSGPDDQRLVETQHKRMRSVYCRFVRRSLLAQHRTDSVEFVASSSWELLRYIMQNTNQKLGRQQQMCFEACTSPSLPARVFVKSTAAVAVDKWKQNTILHGRRNISGRPGGCRTNNRDKLKVLCSHYINFREREMNPYRSFSLATVFSCNLPLILLLAEPLCVRSWGRLRLAVTQPNVIAVPAHLLN